MQFFHHMQSLLIFLSSFLGQCQISPPTKVLLGALKRQVGCQSSLEKPTTQTLTPNSSKTHKCHPPPLNYYLEEPTFRKVGSKEEWAPIHVGANKKHQF